MPKYKLLICFIFLATILSCTKDDSDPWQNNPKKIIVAKSSETLSDLGKRLLGKSIETIGISPIKVDLDEWYAGEGRGNLVYESEGLSIHVNPEDKQSIVIAITQPCNSEKIDSRKLIPLGELFGKLDCSPQTLNELESLAKNSTSGIKAMCSEVAYSPDQETEMYDNFEKRIFWDLSWGLNNKPEKIEGVGIYKDDIVHGYNHNTEACDLKEGAARIADQKIWYAISNTDLLNPTCKVSPVNPGELIELMAKLSEPYRIRDEIKEGDTVVQMRLEVFSRNINNYFYRSKARCECVLNESKEKKDKEISNANKYK